MNQKMKEKMVVLEGLRRSGRIRAYGREELGKMLNCAARLRNRICNIKINYIKKFV